MYDPQGTCWYHFQHLCASDTSFFPIDSHRLHFSTIFAQDSDVEVINSTFASNVLPLTRPDRAKFLPMFRILCMTTRDAGAANGYTHPLIPTQHVCWGYDLLTQHTNIWTTKIASTLVSPNVIIDFLAVKQIMSFMSAPKDPCCSNSRETASLRLSSFPITLSITALSKDRSSLKPLRSLATWQSLSSSTSWSSDKQFWKDSARLSEATWGISQCFQSHASNSEARVKSWRNCL